MSSRSFSAEIRSFLPHWTDVVLLPVIANLFVDKGCCSSLLVIANLVGDEHEIKAGFEPGRDCAGERRGGEAHDPDLRLQPAVSRNCHS